MSDKTADRNQIVEIVKEEVLPLKEQNSQLTSENQKLLKENEQLKEAVEDTKSLLGATKSDILQGIGKLRKSLELNNRLIKENKMLKEEISSVSKRAKTALITERRKLNEEKKALRNKAAKMLESHVNDVSFSAFSSAKKAFAKDFNAIEENILKSLAKTIGPYITDAELPVKVEELKETLNQMKREMIRERREKSDLSKQLKEEKEKRGKILREAEQAKIELYKHSVCKSLPSALYETAIKKMSGIENRDEIKRIYTLVMKEAALSASNQKPKQSPVADSNGKMKSETSSKRVLTESQTKGNQSVLDDLNDINNEELLKLAGID